jgi:hypothetical protein
LQEPYHRYRDTALLNEFHHAVKDVLAIGIESEDESSHHLHSIALDRGRAVEQAAPGILQLVGRDQTGFIGSLNAQKGLGSSEADAAALGTAHCFDISLFFCRLARICANGTTSPKTSLERPCDVGGRAKLTRT